ncbi:MAG: hypothetical protein OXC60_13960 [Litoreibacter sp.]|nr:hypothetical protein [Litoreibacter sp.]
MEQIALFGGVVGAFAIFDVLSEKTTKAKLAELLFGFHSVNPSKVERQLIVTIISAFQSPSRNLSVHRIFLWSLIVSPLCVVLGDIIPVFGFTAGQFKESFFAILSNYIAQPSTFITITLFLALLSLPFDYWSIWVAKKIYITEEERSGFVAFFVDVLVSFAPVVPIMLFIQSEKSASLGIPLVAFALENVSHSFAELLLHLIIYLPIGVVSSICLAFSVRLLGFFISVAARLFLSATKLNQKLVLVSRIHEYPFSFIGLIVFLSYFVWGFF